MRQNSVQRNSDKNFKLSNILKKFIIIRKIPRNFYYNQPTATNPKFVQKSCQISAVWLPVKKKKTLARSVNVEVFIKKFNARSQKKISMR